MATAAPERDLPTRAAGRSSAVLIEGPAGIGKTHRWTAELAAARERGCRILVARPGEAEARLGGTGLVDLLADVTDAELARLPEPQHHALGAALLRTEPDAAADPRIVAVALTNLVQLLAADSPVAIAVDDVQWLDGFTASVLGYLARRCPADGVTFLVSLRTPVDALPSPAAELDQRGLLERHEVAPLDAPAIAGLLRSRLDLRLPASLLNRAAATSGGNPFYAVELARVWANAADALLADLPVPESLHALVGTRIAALPPATRATLAAAAALGRASVADLRALGLAADLPPAERAGLVVIEQGAVSFTHPLLAAAVYDDLTATEQAALHLRVAEIVEDVEQRARHLALATKVEGPDASVAALLDEAVRRAERRADIGAALEAAGLAVHATPPDDELTTARRLILGRLLFKSGDTDGARAELDGLTGANTPRRIRVKALTMLCELAFATISHEAAVRYGQAAIEAAEPGTDDDLLPDAYIYLAQGHDSGAEAAALATRALELVEATPDPNPATYAKALALVAGLRFFAGYGLDRAQFERAMELERDGHVLVEESMTGYYVAVLGYSDETADAAALLDVWEQRSQDEGCESQQPFILMWRSHLLLKSGRLDQAEEVIAEHVRVGELTGQEHNVRYGRYNAARLALFRGDLAAARHIGEELAAGVGGAAIEIVGRRVAGEAALYQGDVDAAVAHLQRVEELRTGGRDDPSALTHLPHLIEALAALGRSAEAAAPLAHLAAKADDAQRRSAFAAVARCRAVLAAAASEQDDALAAFDESLALDDGYPFEHARTLLLKGAVLRRFRRKAQAKETLTAAREAFAALGAAGWVERVDGELARVGLRPPAPTELTPTELRVAELTATGMSAKDVAAVLFVSPRTVEAHLGRAYRKLGVRSRAELVARFARQS